MISLNQLEETIKRVTRKKKNKQTKAKKKLTQKKAKKTTAQPQNNQNLTVNFYIYIYN